MNGTTSTIAPQEEQLSAPAKTHSAPHDAPQMRCTCGLYSAKSLDHLRRAQYWQYGGIHGEVNL